MDIKSLTPETLSVLRQALVHGRVDDLTEFHRQTLAQLELCVKAMCSAFGLPDNQESRAAVFDSFVDATDAMRKASERALLWPVGR